MFLKIFLRSVKFFSYSACMMSQQRYFCMHQPGPSMRSYIIYHLLHFGVAFFKITSIDACALDTAKTLYKIVCRVGSCFFFAYANTPVIVLHQVNNGQLMQSCKLKSLTHFAFGNGSIAQ